jgi:preprotein translocase subunit SecD
MLYISKWKATAILLTALICCLLAVPNFFPESTVKRWPEWAQRHIVLGLDLQGGSHILLEVDANDVRRQKLMALQDDVRRVLREARIGLTRAPVIRGNSVEVAIRENDLQQGVAKLRELAQPLGGFLGSTGARSVDIENVGGGVVRLSPTEPALLERIRQVVDQSVEIIGKRVNQLGLVEPSIQRQGNDRILVQVPGLGDPQQLLEILGKTAKLTFRLVDTSIPVEQARSPASTSARASRSSRSSSIPPARANSRRSPRRTSAGRLRSCSTTRSSPLPSSASRSWAAAVRSPAISPSNPPTISRFFCAPARFRPS